MLVRFTNTISHPYFTTLAPEQAKPCVGTRSGRPISVHLHGSASLAPFDGWADDETCKGEREKVACLGAHASNPYMLLPATKQAGMPTGPPCWTNCHRQHSLTAPSNVRLQCDCSIP